MYEPITSLKKKKLIYDSEIKKVKDSGIDIESMCRYVPTQINIKNKHKRTIPQKQIDYFLFIDALAEITKQKLINKRLKKYEGYKQNSVSSNIS